ncbi:DNA-binding transcriptional regulator, LysR family [Lishizhenia tianjinensis]|uniref:DNA-binding transcriptional regulator, LysR family n=1 Tax=Lishizhenia tianjinensis TaxID=477690 RepID=A0A1I7BX25_9FLAO|nr:LysR family transcriptional regulator [Lishizhenia tianjinensis]SFT91700.1 DNA-binding transcriptional regulator, LysR family [Lishizhenia tianjinensis]
MNYTINQLRIFLKIVETMSVTKAAEELFMTQPAVSIQLKNFQDQFDIPLTEIVGRQLYVTEFGHEVAKIAKRIFMEFDELKYKTREYGGVMKGNLRIASASTGKYVIPYFLSDFLANYSGVDLILDVTNRAKVVEDLKNNKMDFAVVSVLPNDVEVEEEILMENKLFLVGNPDNYKRKEALIFREDGSATRQEMESFFKQKSTQQRKRIELTSNEAVKQAVVAGLGHSLLPLIGIKNELLDGELKIIERKNLPVKTDWRLIWLKNKKMSPVAKAYLEFIKAEKNRIMEKHFQWYQDF